MSETHANSDPATRSEGGIAELSTVSVLNRDWETVALDITAPDVEGPVGQVYLFVCPVCQTIVPPATDQSHFALEHAKWHIKQARDWDIVNQLTGWLEPEEPS